MGARFVPTQTVLDRILARTAEDLAARKVSVSAAALEEGLRRASPPRDLLAAVRRETVALIAEVKHASPSRGALIDPFDPVALALTYAQHGAAALSVLTDAPFFGGSLADLQAVRAAVCVPVLRKDFIIDAYQVLEARAAGADAILLIVAALEDAQLADLHAQALALGMIPLVEVHNERELERALRLDPALIGVNNRDLRTFTVSLAVTERLAPLVPPGVPLVAESGIFTAEDVLRVGRAGARAVLVGEALVTAPDIAARVRELSGQPHEVRP